MSRPADPNTQPPAFNRGLKSALTLTAVCAVAVFSGMFLARTGQQAESDALLASTSVEAAGPALAELLFSAEEAVLGVTLTHKTGTLRSRDNLIDLLARLGADRREAHEALKPLYDSEYLDPRRLRPGLVVNAAFDETGAESTLSAITLRAAPERSLIVKRDAQGWTAAALDVRLTPAHKRVSTTIQTSLYDAALANGARDQQVVDFAQIFAYDVDFQREIHPGDQFEIVYEAWVDERGRPVKTGEVLYAELQGKALTRSFYRHTPSDDEVTDYFDPNGESATKFLMKTPINGARLSSNFGTRRHPISGYTRLHKGTDFAARTGTPIYAAGHGVIERASRYGGYGNYARIRHANGYKTAYAHMSRYGPGVRAGRRIRQGDVIGYVGSTGASTGPHLHYEVMVNGKHVNAMKLELPTGRKLSGDMLDEFMTKRGEVDAIRISLGAETEMASASPDPVMQAR